MLTAEKQPTGDKQMLVGVGVHCAICKRLDFLPFKCEDCGLLYCSDHRTDHVCSKKTVIENPENQVPTCPLCNCAISVGADFLHDASQVNYAVETHISKYCPVANPGIKVAEKKGAVKKYPCQKFGCNTSETFEITCPDCGINVCLKHRLQRDHVCKGYLKKNIATTTAKPAPPKNPFSGAKEAREKLMLQKKQEKLIKTGATEKPEKSTEVTIAKRKSDAEGDQKIPEERRLFLEIIPPLDLAKEQKMIFVNNQWSCGKVLDQAIQYLHLEEITKSGKKLHLMSLESGMQFKNLDTIGDVVQNMEAILVDFAN